MLEMLLILTALAGNQESFNKSSEAYYKYQKLDVTIEKYGKDHPILAQVVGMVGLAKEKKTYVQIQGPWFFETSLQNSEFKNIAWWKKEF